MKILIIPSLFIVALLHGCLSPQKNKEKIIVVNYNIVLAPDLSNRIEDIKPLTDSTITNIIISHIPEVLTSKRDMDQLDRYSVKFINQKWINEYNVNSKALSIDFSSFENQRSRIKYIKNGGLTKDQFSFMKEFCRINRNAKANNSGADIWSFLSSEIDNNDIVKPLKQDSTEEVQQKYRNILILLTDGYIEAGIYRKGYDLSGNKIKSLRNLFILSHESDFKSFFLRHKELQIKPIQNANLKDLEILVLELSDRSLTKSGEATVHPTDGEIIKIAWTDWLNKSNVKRFELHSTFPSKPEAEKTILGFMNIYNGSN